MKNDTQWTHVKHKKWQNNTYRGLLLGLDSVQNIFPYWLVFIKGAKIKELHLCEKIQMVFIKVLFWREWPKLSVD